LWFHCHHSDAFYGYAGFYYYDMIKGIIKEDHYFGTYTNRSVL
jgi:hypothetical protein